MNTIRLLLLLTVVVLETGCAFGPRSLKSDEVDYARAVGDARKREILSLIVGLRYGDAPGVLNLTQIIAAYTFDATGTAIVNSEPDTAGPRASATGALSYSNHPTFTFTPTTGENYAKAYIHPLAPSLILPLADSGIPVDLLLRITVQTIGRLHNATMLGGAAGPGSPQFFELLQILRRLQLAGELSIRYVAGSDADKVMMSIGLAHGRGSAEQEPPQSATDIARLRLLLDLNSHQSDYEIVTGNMAANPTQIPMLTRSVLAILSDLGAEIAVPDSDVQTGATTPTIGLAAGATRPIMVVHASKRATGHPYAAIGYRSSQFWIADADFDSKYALTVVQDVMALAEVTDTSRAPIVTVPAN